MTQENIITICLFFLSLFLWEGLFMWAPHILSVYEGMTQGSGTSHTVDLPINNTISCKNTCGPQSRCSISGEQCTSDVDCYGCLPKTADTNVKTSPEVNVIRGQNDAGKLTMGMTPTYSYLTTDIGTQATTVSLTPPSPSPPTYVQGTNEWRSKFDADKSRYDKLFGPLPPSKYSPVYPERPTLSGEFVEIGPLAANDDL